MQHNLTLRITVALASAVDGFQDSSVVCKLREEEKRLKRQEVKGGGQKGLKVKIADFYLFSEINFEEQQQQCHGYADK